MNYTSFQQSQNLIVDNFVNNVLADGGTVDEFLIQREYDDLHTTIKKQASLVTIGGASKTGVLYGMNPQTSALIPFTFTRASTATYTDKDGLLKTAAANVPRFDYDPVTLRYKGLLMERASTNLNLWSEDIANAVWEKTGTTVTVNSETGPFGTNNGYYLTEDTSTGNHFVLQKASVTSGTSYTVSFYIKKADDSWAQFSLGQVNFGVDVWANFNFDTGLFGNKGATGTWASKQLANNSWLITVTTPATATSSGNPVAALGGTNNTNTVLRAPGYTGTNRKVCNITAIQLETGQPTSYIPTAGSTVTRSADDCYAAVGAWYNTTESSVYAQAIQAANVAAPSRGVVGLSLNIGNRFAIYRQSSGRANTFCDPSTVNTINGGFTTVGQYWKQAGAVTNGIDYTGAAFGLTSGTNPTTLNTASITRIYIANSYQASPEILDGWIKHAAYFPLRLPDTDLQAITL